MVLPHTISIRFSRIWQSEFVRKRTLHCFLYPLYPDKPWKREEDAGRNPCNRHMALPSLTLL